MASIPTLLSHFFANKISDTNKILKEKYNQKEASNKLSTSRDTYNKDGAYLRVKKIKNLPGNYEDIKIELLDYVKKLRQTRADEAIYSYFGNLSRFTDNF